MALGFGPAMRSEQPAAPPKELTQYILDARKHGLKEVAIRKNAVDVGWPAEMVDAAISLVNQKPEPAAAAFVVEPPAAPATALAASPKTPPPASRPSVAETLPEVQKNRGVPDDYQIGAGDILQISVWKEPDASVPSVVVRPDGKVSMPLLKEIAIAGMTPTEVEQSIAEKLSRFITSADVTVMVTAINSKKVYIVGAARKEGPLPYTYRMTIMQAISEAGGLTDYAKRKKIYVLRTENGKQYHLSFNYNEVIKGEKMEQNVELLPGDSLIIPH